MKSYVLFNFIFLLAMWFSHSKANAQLLIYADTNRDGIVDELDKNPSKGWNSEEGGAYFIANVDDDDSDGIPDAEDNIVNGKKDALDLARIKIEMDPQTYEQTRYLTLSLGGDRGLVNLFQITAGKDKNIWKAVNGKITPRSHSIELGIEAKHFAGTNGWDGFVEISVQATDLQGAVIDQASVALGVAPWIMLPNSAKTKKIFISGGWYAESKFLYEDLVDLDVVDVKKYSTKLWQEMWMQDTMEIGYTQMPGMNFPMYVVLSADRCGEFSCDRFPRQLLSIDFGYITVPIIGRQKKGDWDDWFGNLEVSHPVPGWPLGRIYHGSNLNRGLASWLAAQKVQNPFEIDPTWLLIKHVDEIMNFVASKDGKPYLMVVSPRKAAKIMRLKNLDPYNQYVQKRIDDSTLKALQALSMDSSQVIELPLLFDKGGIGRWSNPVNSVHLNGVIAIGSTLGKDEPEALKDTKIGMDIEKTIEQIGLSPMWVNDIAYQPNHGNVHCATNTVKVPVKSRFWE